MMSDNDFIEKTWKKYEMNMKKPTDSFYKKHQYKFIETVRIIKTTIISVLSVMVLSGAVYAGYSGVNYVIEKYYVYNKSNGNNYDVQDTKNVNPIYLNKYEDYSYSNGILYKIVDNYDDYKNLYNITESILPMNKEDFIDNNLLIISPFLVNNNNKAVHYSVIDMYEKNQKLNVIINQDDSKEITKEDKIDLWIKYNVEKDFNNILLKIPKNYLKDNISIFIKNEMVDVSNNKQLIDIDENYTIEQAFEDGCFVINNNGEVLSNDKNLFKQFVNNSLNGNESYIRIYDYGENSRCIEEIQFKDGYYLYNKKDLIKDVIWTERIKKIVETEKIINNRIMKSYNLIVLDMDDESYYSIEFYE